MRGLPQGASSGYLRAGGNVPNKAFEPGAVKIPAHFPAIEVRASPAAPLDMEVGPSKMGRQEAIQSGFTGDQCMSCNSMHMKISGHCLVCTDCGTTTGCS